MVALRNALERRAMVPRGRGLRALTQRALRDGGAPRVMNAMYAQIAKVAPTRTRVLITGESGTGKELIARAVHRESALKNQSFVKVNCAAIPPELIESELFGTSAARSRRHRRKRGHFEVADGAPSSWTRSRTDRLGRRPRCCACCSRASSPAWAANRP